MADLRNSIAEYSRVARPEILRDHGPNSCIASTWITIQVMRRLGFTAQVLEVRAQVENAAFAKLRARLGRGPSEDELRGWTEKHGAWTVGLGYGRTIDDGIGGHLVAIVRESYLVDASINQANVPRHNIKLPATLWGPVSPGFLSGEEVCHYQLEGIVVKYERQDVENDYTTSCDWSHNPETDGAVERILQALKLRGAGTK